MTNNQGLLRASITIAALPATVDFSLGGQSYAKVVFRIFITTILAPLLFRIHTTIVAQFWESYFTPKAHVLVFAPTAKNWIIPYRCSTRQRLHALFELK